MTFKLNRPKFDLLAHLVLIFVFVLPHKYVFKVIALLVVKFKPFLARIVKKIQHREELKERDVVQTDAA